MKVERDIAQTWIIAALNHPSSIKSFQYQQVLYVDLFISFPFRAFIEIKSLIQRL